MPQFKVFYYHAPYEEVTPPREWTQGPLVEADSREQAAEIVNRAFSASESSMISLPGSSQTLLLPKAAVRMIKVV